MKVNMEQLNELRNDIDLYIKRIEKATNKEIKAWEQYIPLFVELGELMNNFPTKIKYWKPSTSKDNREAGLEEFAYCLNFMMIILNKENVKIENANTVNTFIDFCINNVSLLSLLEVIPSVSVTPIVKFYNLLALGDKLGFTWEEIYTSTKKKIEIINARLHKEFNKFYRVKHVKSNVKSSNFYEYFIEYDDKGHLIHIKDSNGYEAWATCDEKGNMIHKKDNKNIETSYENTYDDNGNLIRVKTSSGFEELYEYDEKGNCIYKKELTGFEYWYEYDDQGNIINEKDSNGSNYTYKNTYDKIGRLIYQESLDMTVEYIYY